MPPLRTCLTTALALAALAAPASAQTSGYDDPLLSGYGNPGAAEQQLFGTDRLDGGGGAAGGGSSRGGGGAAGATALAPAPVPAATPPAAAQAPATGRGTRPQRPARDRGRTGEATARTPAVAAPPLDAGPVRAERLALPVSPADLLAAGLALLALAGLALVARRRTTTPLGA